MKKSNSIVIAIIIIIVLIGGGYAIFHKSSKTRPTPATAGSGQSSAPAVNNAILITKSGSVGQYLADPAGNTLYTYSADSSGVSNCTGSCLANWPIYQDKGSTSGLPAGVSTIKRSDNGQTQYTYMGMPLYYFINDSKGQVTGNGVDNFQVAKPAAAASSSSSSSTPATSTPSTSAPASSSSSSSNY